MVGTGEMRRPRADDLVSNRYRYEQDFLLCDDLESTFGLPNLSALLQNAI